MIRITVDTEDEFTALGKAMDLPSLGSFPFQLNYHDPARRPAGSVVGTGRITSTAYSVERDQEPLPEFTNITVTREEV